MKAAPTAHLQEDPHRGGKHLGPIQMPIATSESQQDEQPDTHKPHNLAQEMLTLAPAPWR